MLLPASLADPGRPEGGTELAPPGAPGLGPPPRPACCSGGLPACGVEAYVIDAPAFYTRRAGGPYADAHHQPHADNHLRFALPGWTAAQLAGGLDTGCARSVHWPRLARRPRPGLPAR